MEATRPTLGTNSSVNLFVTGTDTGVGKTHTVVQLLRLLRASGKSCAGFKPICCGDRQDAKLLRAAGSDDLAIDQINPVWLKTPAAPLTASLAEGVEIDVERLFSAFKALQKQVECVLVEGVGGWLVPIRANGDETRTYFVSDLAAAMQLPVLVVARNRLGCLNHTALTVRSVAARGLKCVGVALNSLPGAEDVALATNAEILRKIIDPPLLSGLAENMSELPVKWREALGLGEQARVAK
jgi:dethiobiotin synthetase